ncbi:hypothetical protein TNCV_4728431 [Trichonephila clavipes]|nr:hypothetical protein TNCV_4728431 [Trichonephila clavipes]
MNILDKREEKAVSKRMYCHFSTRIISHKPIDRTPQSLARKMESKNLMVGYDTIVTSLIILRKEKRCTIFFLKKSLVSRFLGKFSSLQSSLSLVSLKFRVLLRIAGRGSLVVKVSDRSWLITSSSPQQLKTTV